MAEVKQIKIQTGVVKRLTKEKTSYEKEVEKEQERYRKFESQGKDEYELRKQTEVIEESRNMVPDTKNRLRKAKADLQAVLEKCKEPGPAIADDAAYKDATKDAIKALEEAEKVIEA